jgi:hypothetical protein
VSVLTRFTVHTRGDEHGAAPGWMRVVVYDDVEHLRSDAARYAVRAGEEDHDHTRACFQGYAFRLHVDGDGHVDEPAQPYAGVMRLWVGQMGWGTLAHEVTHAAMAMYYRQHALTLEADQAIACEEVLCYTVGDLMGGLVEALTDRGLVP